MHTTVIRPGLAVHITRSVELSTTGQEKLRTGGVAFHPIKELERVQMRSRSISERVKR